MNLVQMYKELCPRTVKEYEQDRKGNASEKEITAYRAHTFGVYDALRYVAVHVSPEDVDKLEELQKITVGEEMSELV